MFLIYGGTGAIGFAIAQKLAADGHAVHLVARDARKLEDAARTLGGDFTDGDATDPALFERATRSAASNGALSGLVYAVGNIRLKPFHRVSDEEATHDFTLNALGALRAVRAARELLVAGEGAVLLFSTVAVAQGFANHAAIAMAKGAVEGLTRTLAAELAPKVRVNAIAPSLTLGGMGEAIGGAQKMRQAIAGMHPLKRLGEGQDMAAIAAALLARGAWISGQVIGVDGGRGRLRTAE
ncbi:SDR family NAD(P)-dependent oxidoreductase [Acuticoccus sp.]|uniref:SDR family NAD(P)-dependent oxidoreductase n=1 Tax=Acuticoccus sp. TaxID=1904378 RepID=UPI003B51D482